MKQIKKTITFIASVFLISIASAQQNKSFLWIGGPTYLLQLGSFKILTDPMLGAKNDSAFMIKKHPTTGEANAFIKRFTEPATFDNTNIDLLLISHLHADHFDKKAKETLSKNLKTICPASQSETLVKWGFINTTGLKWGDTLILTKGLESIKIISLKALHAKDDPLKTELGEVNGYIIEYTFGKSVYRIYWSGDTVWFDEMQSFKQYGRIDLFVPNMGSVGSDGKIGRRGLNAEECLKIAELLQPNLIIPVHHSTFSHYVEPISVLQKLSEKTNYKSQIKIIKESSTIKLESKMTTINLNNAKIDQYYFTDKSDNKNSSLVKLSPHALFVTEKEKQSDIYLIEGSISIDGQTYESGTYISTGKSKKLLASDQGARFFFYQEPINKTSIEIALQPTQQVWVDGGVNGMKNVQLRSSGHSLLLVSWEPGTEVSFHIHPYGEEVFVLKGELFDRETSLKSEEWIRMNPNTGHAPNAKEKTLILLRNGHL